MILECYKIYSFGILNYKVYIKDLTEKFPLCILFNVIERWNHISEGGLESEEGYCDMLDYNTQFIKVLLSLITIFKDIIRNLSGLSLKIHTCRNNLPTIQFWYQLIITKCRMPDN